MQFFGRRNSSQPRFSTSSDEPIFQFPSPTQFFPLFSFSLSLSLFLLEQQKLTFQLFASYCFALELSKRFHRSKYFSAISSRGVNRAIRLCQSISLRFRQKRERYGSGRYSPIFVYFILFHFFILLFSPKLELSQLCLSDRAQIWLPQPMINGPSYPQRLSHSLSLSLSSNWHPHTLTRSRTQKHAHARTPQHDWLHPHTHKTRSSSSNNNNNLVSFTFCFFA